MEIEKRRTASIDVDAQKGFTPLCPDQLPVEGGDTIVGALNAQAEFARIRVGSKDSHNRNAVWIADEKNAPFTEVEGKNVDIRWPAHCIMGEEGAEQLEGLPEMDDYDYFVWKGMEPTMHPYGACYHDLNNKLTTGLIEFLKMNNITTVIVGGLALNYCVKETALQLAKARFNVVVNLEACRGIDNGTIQPSIDEMNKAGVQFVKETKELVNKEDVVVEDL